MKGPYVASVSWHSLDWIYTSGECRGLESTWELNSHGVLEPGSVN